MLLYQVCDAFEKAKLGYAVVGGYALALHGIVRATMDVDFVLSLETRDFELAEKVLDGLGLTSRIPVRAGEVISMRKEFIERRNMVAWSFVDFSNPTRVVDILITENLAKIETVRISVAGRKISVATMPEILKMKTKAGRPQDLVDIQNIKEKLNGKS